MDRSSDLQLHLFVTKSFRNSFDAIRDLPRVSGVRGDWVTLNDRFARTSRLLVRIQEHEYIHDTEVLLGLAFLDSDQPPSREGAGEAELVPADTGDLWFYFVFSGQSVSRLSYEEVRSAGIWGVEESMGMLSEPEAGEPLEGGQYCGWFVSASTSPDVELEKVHGLHTLL